MITAGSSILAMTCMDALMPRAHGCAGAATLTAPPQVSQVVISMSPKAPTFGENPFQALCLYALGCRSSRRDVLRLCSHLFYCFPSACCPCHVLPVLSVPTGHKGTVLAIRCEHAVESSQVNPGLRHQGASRAMKSSGSKMTWVVPSLYGVFS